MTLQEFKAWFDGYTEEMDDAPTAKQWKKIKAKVKDINGEQIVYRDFYHNYWRPYYTYYGPYYYGAPVVTLGGHGGTSSCLGGAGGVSLGTGNINLNCSYVPGEGGNDQFTNTVEFNSCAAMYDAGKNEWKAELAGS